ncbi:MAG TPA: MFS transporter [Kofleriaceae bacterium]|jgi:MFS family permease
MIKNRTAILALLTGLNLLNYIDRAVVAAVLDPMQAELGLSSFAAGALNSVFLIGYFLTSPFFGARADKGARKGLIALGVAIWSLATAASGLSTGLWTLVAARVVVGVGEASYATLAPTIIDDLTPPEKKARALSIFYMAIPVGYALGYIFGGMLGKAWGWRAAFYVTGVPGLLLAVTCLFIVEPPRKLVAAKGKLVDGLREMIAIPQFRRSVIGYAIYTAGVGAFSFWAPKFLVARFPAQLDLKSANFWFGTVLVVAGAAGTLIGGRWADRASAGQPPKTGTNAMLRVCAWGMIIATPLSAMCFFAAVPWQFYAIAFAAQLGLFLSTSPISAVALRSVPEERRASAMAAQIFCIHLFGDLWSAAALGALMDVLPLTVAMMALPVAFAGAAYVWWPRRREAAVVNPPA